MKNTPPFLSNEAHSEKTRLLFLSRGLLFVSLLLFSSGVFSQGDNCDQALALTNVTNFCSSANQYTSAGSTASGFSVGSCWTATATSDVWFSFVAIGTNVLISVNGATMMQPRIAIYSGTCAGGLTQLPGGCTNGTGGSPDSQLFNSGLVQGTTYFIRISTTSTQRGTFQLCINNYTPPPTASADCGGAGRLCNKNPISVTNLTSGGVNNNENAGTCLSGFGIFETNSVWYTWTCQTAGTLTMDILPANQIDDIDFIVFQLSTSNPCGPRTAIRCSATSAAGANGGTGMNASSTDVSEAVGWSGIEDGYVQQVNMTAGTSYAILINNTNATNGFTLNWGGTGTFVGPDANITGGPFVVCSGTPISIDGSTSTDYNSLSWNFVNGSGTPANATGAGPHSVTYSTPGTYVAILNATSSLGCTSVETATITVSSGVVPTFAAVPAFCSGQAAPAFPAQTNTPVVAGTWSPNVISNTASGTYTFTPNSGQCSTTPVNISVTVNPSVTPTFPAHPQYCVNDVPQSLPTTSDNGVAGTWSPAAVNTTTAGTANYTFTPTGNPCAAPVTIAIVVGAAPTPTFTQIPAFCSGTTAPVLPATSSNSITGTWSPATINNTTSGTYTFTPDAGQCATTATMSITVNNPVTPNLTAAGPFCTDALPVNLTADIPGGTWTGTGITDATGVFDPAVAGAGTHTINYVHTQGCGGTNSMDVVVNPLPDSDFTADVLSGCSPLTVHFTADPSVTGSSWDFGDNTTANTIGTAEHTFTAGTYSITLTNTLNGCSSSTTKTNYITVSPIPDASFSANPQVLPQTETTSQFDNHSLNGDTYFWTFGDGDNSDLENPSHHFPQVPGNYPVTLTVTSANGCTDVATLIITVRENKLIYVPNAFTPDGDEFNNVFAPVISAGYDLQNYSFTIFNRWGETLFESHDVTKGWDGTYMGKLVQAGIYTWTIRIKSLNDDSYEVFNGHLNMMR
ncbi:PKD domain-containing protein [Fluviicola sp.]|uniref:PKD domain-containing protein n=1 Tax=Fluviicola sp. TaxID=1917219 RepID=UPI0031DAB2C4